MVAEEVGEMDGFWISIKERVTDFPSRLYGGGVQNDAIDFHLSSYKAEFPFPDAGETKWPECAAVNSGVACGRLRDRSLS